jgi:hypothetical protein
MISRNLSNDYASAGAITLDYLVCLKLYQITDFHHATNLISDSGTIVEDVQ